MNIQEKFDGITKIQKLLLYNISFLLFIFSIIFLGENKEEIGFTLLLLGLLYLDIILFFEFRYVIITKHKLVKTLKTIRKIILYLLLILILLSLLVISFVGITKVNSF